MWLTSKACKIQWCRQFLGVDFSISFFPSKQLKCFDFLCACREGNIDPTSSCFIVLFELWNFCYYLKSGGMKNGHIWTLILLLWHVKQFFFVTSGERGGSMSFGGCIQLMGFCTFEACVGLFWPSIMKMRSQYIPEEARSTIMNFFRIPLNIFVCVVLYNVSLNCLYLCANLLGTCV